MSLLRRMMLALLELGLALGMASTYGVLGFVGRGLMVLNGSETLADRSLSTLFLSSSAIKLLYETTNWFFLKCMSLLIDYRSSIR